MKKYYWKRSKKRNVLIDMSTASRILFQACVESYKAFESMERAMKVFAIFPLRDPSTMFETLIEYNGFLVEV